jgi:hypothetical protein
VIVNHAKRRAFLIVERETAGTLSGNVKRNGHCGNWATAFTVPYRYRYRCQCPVSPLCPGPTIPGLLSGYEDETASGRESRSLGCRRMCATGAAEVRKH